MSAGSYCEDGSDCNSGYCLLSNLNQCKDADYVCTYDLSRGYDRCGGQPCYNDSDCASNLCWFGRDTCYTAYYSKVNVDTCSEQAVGSYRCDGVACSSSNDCESLACLDGKCGDSFEKWNEELEDAV